MGKLPTHRVGCTCECGVQRMVMVNTERYWKWQRGEGHIQNLLPELSANDREALMTGTCPECWAKMEAEAEED